MNCYLYNDVFTVKVELNSCLNLQLSHELLCSDVFTVKVKT